MNNDLILVSTWLSTALMSPGLKLVVGGVLFDMILGISLSLKLGKFDWRKLAQFLKTNIAPYVMSYVGLYVIMASMGITESDIGAAGIQTILSGIIIANLRGDIMHKLAQLRIVAHDSDQLAM